MVLGLRDSAEVRRKDWSCMVLDCLDVFLTIYDRRRRRKGTDGERATVVVTGFKLGRTTSCVSRSSGGLSATTLTAVTVLVLEGGRDKKELSRVNPTDYRRRFHSHAISGKGNDASTRRVPLFCFRLALSPSRSHCTPAPYDASKAQSSTH